MQRAIVDTDAAIPSVSQSLSVRDTPVLCQNS